MTPGEAAHAGYMENDTANLVADEDIAARMWAGMGHERTRWENAALRAIAIAAAAPAPAGDGGLRAALEETLANWRDSAKYLPTDTRDEMSENQAILACADTLAEILDSHPQQPQAAPGADATVLRALLDHETRLTWQSQLPGEQARVAVVRAQAGLEALA